MVFLAGVFFALGVEAGFALATFGLGVLPTVGGFLVFVDFGATAVDFLAVVLAFGVLILAEAAGLAVGFFVTDAFFHSAQVCLWSVLRNRPQLLTRDTS